MTPCHAPSPSCTTPTMHSPHYAHPPTMHTLQHAHPPMHTPPATRVPPPCMPPLCMPPLPCTLPCHACTSPCHACLPTTHVPLPCTHPCHSCPQPKMPPAMHTTCGQNDCHTPLKIYPSPKLHLRVVKINPPRLSYVVSIKSHNEFFFDVILVFFRMNRCSSN